MTAGPRRVLVVGTGLIGTSIGLALRRAGVDVLLRDTRPGRAQAAADLGAGTVDDPAQWTGPAAPVDVAVVATPPAVVPTTVVALQQAGVAGVVTDVASVKLRPLREVAALGGDLRTYVGSHPLAGRERSGPQAARGDLFEGVPWVIAPGQDATPAAVAAVTALVVACGGLPIRLGAAEHDDAVAVVSHLPHLMAVLTATRLTDATDSQVALAGQGVRDVTRVAASDPGLWQQILRDNAGPVLAQLQAVRGDLDTLIAALRALGQGGAPDALVDVLRRGVTGRSRIPGKHGGPAAPYATVAVVVPDRPGELARILTAAGDVGVNVEDVRIEHSPGQAVGLLELAVRPEVAARAARALAARGWTVHAPSPDDGEPAIDPEAGPAAGPAAAAAGPAAGPAAAAGRRPLVVAIDGPSGSGKSTVARAVAARLGLRYLDTGAMYRALTWWCLHRGIDLADRPAVAAAALTLPLELGMDPRQGHVVVDGVDVTAEIRTTRISEQVSVVATNLDVRTELRRRQRELIEPGGVVAEGRDITTVVAPDANVRVLLTADETTRLARRAREVHGDVDAASLAATRDQVLRRDAQDATVAAFTTAADGVVLVDSSARSPDEVVDIVLGLASQVSSAASISPGGGTVPHGGGTVPGVGDNGSRGPHPAPDAGDAPGPA